MWSTNFSPSKSYSPEPELPGSPMRHATATQSLSAPKLSLKQKCGHGRIFQIQIGPKTCFQIRSLPHPATDWPHLRDRPATTIGRLRPLSDTGKRVSPASVVSRQLQEWSQRERSKSESAQRNREPGIQPSAPIKASILDAPPLSISCPFLIQSSLCIMNPYPPKHQERTPL